MANKTYLLRIEEMEYGVTTGVTSTFVTAAQYQDIMAIASVRAEDYEPMNLSELLFEDEQGTL